MLSCKQASALASKSLDTRLAWRERFGLRLHLLFCSICRRYARDLRFLRRAWGRFADNPVSPRASLSTTARERIAQALSEDKQS